MVGETKEALERWLEVGRMLFEVDAELFAKLLAAHERTLRFIAMSDAALRER